MEPDAKKQIPLRLSAKLYADLSQWAADDFRSLNGQIEYLLTECVRRPKFPPEVIHPIFSRKAAIED